MRIAPDDLVQAKRVAEAILEHVNLDIFGRESNASLHPALLREVRKAGLARPLPCASNGAMVRIPRSLARKYIELAREQQQLRARLAQVDTELVAVVYAFKVVDPAWSPPKALPRPQKRVTTLARGKGGSDVLGTSP